MKALLALAMLIGVAHADTLFASEHDGKLVVSKLVGDKVETVYEEANTSAIEYAFSDADTLWVLRAHAGKFMIGRADLKPGAGVSPQRILTRADWKPKTNRPTGFPPHLVIGKDGGAWLARCVDSNIDNDLIGTCPIVYLRVDTPAPVTDKLDAIAFVASHWWDSNPAALATAPAGWSLAQTGAMLACKGPSKRWSLALGTRMALGIQWLSADPAIARFDIAILQTGKMPPPQFRLEADVRDPYAVRDSAGDDGTGVFYIDACTTILRQVIAIAPDVIATSEGDRAWKLRRGKQVLATFTATRVVAAPF